MLEPGATIGRYTIIRLLGEGGMGAVYLAHDGQLDRRVALKLLHATTSADARARMAREARVMARFVHPNIVTVYDAGDSGGQFYIVMELVEGQTLAGWLEAEPRTIDAILTTFRTAGVALAEAHAAGVAHRDFKPENVLLDKNGRIAVSDFGIASEGSAEAGPASEKTGPPSIPSMLPALPLAATVAGNSGSLTRTGTMMGTPAYMSPEQFLGKPAGPASDQFSFGVALFEALFDQPPFPAQTIEELRRAVLRGELAPIPDAKRALVPPSVLRALVRAMAREPASRFPDMRALVAAIEPPRPKRRAGLVYAVIGVLVIVAASTGGFFMWRKRVADEAKRQADETMHRLARDGSHRACKPLVTDKILTDCIDVPANGPLAHVYFVVDNSAAMAAHKDDEKKTLLTLTDHFGIHTPFGLSLFPAKNATQCEPGGEMNGALISAYTPQRDADHHAELLKNLDTPPSGLAAAPATLHELATLFKKRKSPRTAVVLLTDGGVTCGSATACAANTCTLNIESRPTCTPAGPSCCTTGEACLADAETIAAIKELLAEGIHTYVAGVAPRDRYKEVLERFAAAGGTKHWYDASAGEAELEADVRHALFNHVPVCTFDLPSALERPEGVAVLFDGELAPGDWKAEKKKLTLSGAACDQVLGGHVGDIRIVSD